MREEWRWEWTTWTRKGTSRNMGSLEKNCREMVPLLEGYDKKGKDGSVVK